MNRVTLLVISVLTSATLAQERELQDEDLAVRVTPASLTLAVGATAKLEAEVVDVGGRPVEGRVIFFSRDRRSVSVTREGEVTARKPGSVEIVARMVREGSRGPSATVRVDVTYPELDRVEFVELPGTLHVGTTVRLVARVVDVAGSTRDDLRAAITVSDRALISMDDFGFITGLAPGRCLVTARYDDVVVESPVLVIANPVTALTLEASAEKGRTGDVITFSAHRTGIAGADLEAVPVHFSFHARADDDLGQGASGLIEQDGRFVAETPGFYTVVAHCGAASARKTVRIDKRIKEEMKLINVGQGKVLDKHSSDLWVWEGVDGRDYCVTGTWGADGEAYFWDVTDPADMKKIATVKVDARTVNDVKVSEDGRICVISREGASNRKNGIVIIDVADPKDPKILSTFDDELTGGVHNVFIQDDHVYALSAGRRYDIIDIENPEKPKRVGSYQVFEPGASIHDVWVEDGIAYSSNWRHGVHMVDVGNGIAGGSPSNPVKISEYAYPSGWNHAAFPFKNEKTGKFYVIAGDEAFPFGLHLKDEPTYARGWMHFIDFSDLANPKEVARYQVPEAGTHNMWVEDEKLYAAYYNGGLRVVDISGDLMGDLYKQGREIATYLPTDSKSLVPNAPMVWGPQPHKGHIFFTDWNSGLWAVKLVPNSARP